MADILPCRADLDKNIDPEAISLSTKLHICILKLRRDSGHTNDTDSWVLLHFFVCRLSQCFPHHFLLCLGSCTGH